MFDCGCHDNDTSDAINMAFFVHSPSKPTTTQKNNGAFKNLFPTLLHCLQESLLKLYILPLKKYLLHKFYILAFFRLEMQLWLSLGSRFIKEEQ